MRLNLLLIHPSIVLILQQAVSIWFLVDFFLARDSSIAGTIFGTRATNASPDPKFQRIFSITERLQANTCNSTNEVVDTSFDKLIFIIIDALGSQFLQTLRERDVRNDHSADAVSIPFLDEMVKADKAFGFIAKAATPTVTMPRVKALISGTIPSFMDVLYNLASDVSNFQEENILQLAKARNKSIVFYGDDVWLSLFDRSVFHRSKETSSLYASDYTSVDTNVTEMVLPETRKNAIDWDFLILHYLGLDHIGHVFGSNRNQLIRQKLLEMSEVIREVHENMSKKDHKTLIVVCGDHGMSSQGNHGGDTNLEIDTAMVFLPINYFTKSSYRTLSYQGKNVQQIDLASTLSYLFNLGIPQTSRGVLIENLLENLWFDKGEKLFCAALDNFIQLIRLSDVSIIDGFIIDEISKIEATARNSLPTKDLFKLLRDIQTHLLKTSAARGNPMLVMMAVAVIMLLSGLCLRRSSIRLLMPLMPPRERLVCAIIILLPIVMQNSTDYIELEAVFWPIFAVTTFLIFALIPINRNYNLIKNELDIFRSASLAITFLITGLWRILAPSKIICDLGWSLPTISILILCNMSKQTSKMSGKQSGIFLALGLIVLMTKVIEEASELHQIHVPLMENFSLVFLVITSLINIFVSIKKGDSLEPSIVQKLAISWMWYIFLLSRSHNYIFLISNMIMEASINSISNTMRFSPITRALIYLQFSTSAFYCQGNSNLFSSLDVKPAFYGQTSYNFMLAVPLVACATFGTQIYWYIKLFQRVQGEKEQERMQIDSLSLDTIAPEASHLIPDGTKRAIKDFVDMRNFLVMGYFMFVCIVLRDHLFIWSVLSPKLVYLYVTNFVLRLTTSLISRLPPFIVKAIEVLISPGSKYKQVHNY